MAGKAKPVSIKQHEVWLKSLGYTKLKPSDRFYPVGAPEAPGAVYQKDTGENTRNQIGLFADGGWDAADNEGGGYHSGDDYESLVREVRS